MNVREKINLPLRACFPPSFFDGCGNRGSADGDRGSATPGDEVRLRLVLGADGTVKYIFPMKPEKHGLTEAAMEAARQIKFKPAIKNGQTVSQFLTLAYEFKNGKSRKPFVPESEFYF